MLSIVFTIDNIQRGGKERQLFILASELLKRGYDINIITIKYSHDNYLIEYNFPKERLKIINSDSLIKRFWIHKSLLVNLKPKIIFSFDLMTSIFNLLLYKHIKAIFINGSIQHGIRLFRVSHIMRSLILWLSPYRLANSLAGLKANNLKPSKKNFILYNGIEDKFKNKLTNIEKEEHRKRIIKHYISNSIVFSSVANFVPYKDYNTVLEALSKIKNEYNFYYLIIGDGPLRRQIEAKIKELYLENNVYLLGKVQNVDTYLKISDIFIHSSKGEGISNAILEAMFSGLPIIATNVGGTPELVYKKSFKLFNYKDVSGLCKILMNIKNEFYEFNPDDNDYLRHLEKFSVESMVKNFEKILKQIKVNEEK